MKPSFSGHETFPLRQLWLPKAFQHVYKDWLNGKGGHFFAGESAMIELGVGKNMVTSMRFWALATSILQRDKQFSLTPTPLGLKIFGKEDNLDPYVENPATAWLVHWNLASVPDKLTVFWYLFNHINNPSITRTELQEDMREFAKSNDIRVSDLTLMRDVEVCLRSYLPMLSARNKKMSEEFVEPLLGDLGIIESNSRDVINFRRNARQTLNDAIFAYALLDYWNHFPNKSATLDFNAIAYAIGSPGRVFKIDENSLVQRLENLEQLTDGVMMWTEQAGVRTVIRKGEAIEEPMSYMFRLLDKAYA